MVCAVTGAAGHIGTNLVRELLAEGRDTRIIDLREPAALVALGAGLVTADVRDPVAMAAALTGVDTVFHLAAVISVTGSRGGVVEDVNVNGVRTVAEAALRAGVRRLVHCSSVHAFDLEAVRGRPVDEQAPRSLARRLPAYDRSKAAGEVQLRRVVEQGLDAVVVNPTGVIGPRDEQPSRMGHFFLALEAGQLPATVEGGFDWVDVRDVVTALLATETRGRTGENYLVGGHYATTRELAEIAHAVTGVAAPRVEVPLWFARLWSPAATLVSRTREHPLLYTRDSLHALASMPRVDSSKAQRELGHRPRSTQSTVTDLYAWFAQSGLLRDRRRRGHGADPAGRAARERRWTTR